MSKKAQNGKGNNIFKTTSDDPKPIKESDTLSKEQKFTNDITQQKMIKLTPEQKKEISEKLRKEYEELMPEPDYIDIMLLYNQWLYLSDKINHASCPRIILDFDYDLVFTENREKLERVGFSNKNGGSIWLYKKPIKYEEKPSTIRVYHNGEFVKEEGLDLSKENDNII